MGPVNFWGEILQGLLTALRPIIMDLIKAFVKSQKIRSAVADVKAAKTVEEKRDAGRAVIDILYGPRP